MLVIFKNAVQCDNFSIFYKKYFSGEILYLICKKMCFFIKFTVFCENVMTLLLKLETVNFFAKFCTF